VLAVRPALFNNCNKKSATDNKISIPNPRPFSFAKFFEHKSLYTPEGYMSGTAEYSLKPSS
jgi:hypothetical protein